METIEDAWKTKGKPWKSMGFVAVELEKIGDIPKNARSHPRVIHFPQEGNT